MLVIVSAIVAFEGWPGGSIPGRIGTLVVQDAPRPAWDVPGTERVAAQAFAAASTVAAQPTGPVVADFAASGAPGLPGLRNLVDPGVSPTTPGDGEETVGPGLGGGRDILTDANTLLDETTANVDGLLLDTTHGLGQEVTTLGGGLGGLGGEIDPNLGALLGQSGSALGGTLDELGIGASGLLNEGSTTVSDVLCAAGVGCS